MSPPQEGDARPSATMNLLHAGAGLHAHEYSPPAAPSSNSRPARLPLRSYDSSPVQRLRPNSYQDTTKNTTPHIASAAYIRPARRLSNTRRRTTTERVSFLDKPIDIHTLNMSAPLHDDDSSDDGMSVASSTFSGSAASASGKGKRRTIKHAETNYYLAGPAPTMTQKQRLIHLRPRMVLQLQRIPLSGRPIPILEVRSSSTFVPRIAKKFPGLYKGSGQLGINDVMICKSENYHDNTTDGCVPETSCGTEAYDEREIIAVICQTPKDSGYFGELCFDDSTRWTMAPGRGRSFELTKTDSVTGENVVARWVPAGTSRRSSYQTPVSKQTRSAADLAKMAKDEKYTFSIIDPSKRRHPVIATLKPTGLAIKDTYSPIDSLPSTSSISPPLPAEDEDSPSIDLACSTDGLSSYPLLTDLPIIRTTEDQKLLIEISAVWVASRLGWCPWYDAAHSMPTSPAASGSKSSGRQRSSTLTPPGSASKHKRQRSGTVSSIAEGVIIESGSLSLTRRNGSLFKRASVNNAVFHSDSDQSPPRATPRRAVSTGAAFMQRQAEKKSSRPPSECDSKCGSATTSRNNSRPSSPRRACSADMLGAFGTTNKHGEALTKSLQQSEGYRNSLPVAMRRTQSDYSTLSSPHCEIGEAVKPEITPNPLLHGQVSEAVTMKRRESAAGNKKVDSGAVPRRATTLPSRKAKKEAEAEAEKVLLQKGKVGKMKVFIGFFSSRQRAMNREVRQGVYH